MPEGLRVAAVQRTTVDGDGDLGGEWRKRPGRSISPNLLNTHYFLIGVVLSTRKPGGGDLGGPFFSAPINLLSFLSFPPH